MASEEEPSNDLKLAISSKILELEALTRAAGDAVVSDHLKQISESENQLLSLHRALVKKLKRTSKSDASVIERQTWFSNFVSRDQKRLSDREAEELASITKHWALTADEIKCVEACAEVWAKYPHFFCDGAAPDKDVVRRCYNDLERIEDHDPTRRKVLLVTLSRHVHKRQNQLLLGRKTRKRCRKSQSDHDSRSSTFLNSALSDICLQLWNDLESHRDVRRKRLGRYSLFGWKWDRLTHKELILSLTQVAAKRFELRRWSHLEVEALNAYTETLPQFTARETLRKAWVAILDYYEGNWNGNTTLHQTAEPSPKGIEISQVHVESAAHQGPTSDECTPSTTPVTSDRQPISCLDEPSVRQASQASAMCFSSHSLGSDDSLEEINASADPWLYLPTDPSGTDGGRAEVTVDNVTASADPWLFLRGPDGNKPEDTVDDIIASADSWLVLPDVGGNKTDPPMNSFVTCSADPMIVSAALQQPGQHIRLDILGIPRLNMLNDPTFTTPSQSVEGISEA